MAPPLRHRVLTWLRPPTAAGFSLTRLFAIVGAAAVGLFSIAMGALLSGWLESHMLERDAALGRDFVQSIADVQQVSGYFEGRPGAEQQSTTLEFFTHVAAMPDVLRANVYAPDRRVLWSSTPDLIGKVFPANDELDEALRGRVVVNREEEGQSGDKAEHQGLDAAGHEYVENYLPVFKGRTRQLIGVIEVYRRPDALFVAIRQGQTLIWAGAAGGGVFLFAVLVWFVRHTERALREQQRRLVEAEALAIVGELSAAVAHSIRNPLVSIRTTAELERELGGDGRGVHAETMRNVDRIEHLVRTLLTYAAAPVDVESRTDLGDVLRDAAERFAPQIAANGRRLEVDVPPGLGVVAADPVLLAQVFDSLLSNASEATRAPQQVRLSARRHGATAEVEVADTGAGIDPAQLAHIFKPFHTTKPRGLGLGLTLVRRIVERLGGRVDIESQPGAGTTVQVQLPVLA